MNIDNTSYQSPNHSGAIVDYRDLVLHHTCSAPFDNGEGTANYLSHEASQVSANYLVCRNGQIYEIVAPGIVAWHAGRGSGFGIPDNAMNNYSVGIEIVNCGDGSDPYPEVQLTALDELIAYIDNKMGVANIIDHKMWAPGRKDDMSSNFPLNAYITNRRHAAPYVPPKTLVSGHLHFANRTPAQMIFAIPVPGKEGAVFLQSAIREMNLEVGGYVTAARQPVRFAAPTQGMNQMWYLIPHEHEYGILYEIVSALSSLLTLDVKDGNTESGAGLQVYVRNNTPAQMFAFIPIGGNSTGFYIMNQKALLPIDMDNAGN